MKTRTFVSTLLIVFALVLVAGFASAASLTITPTLIPTNVSHNAGSFTIQFNLRNDGVADSSVSFASSAVTTGTGTIIRPAVAIPDGSTTPQTLSLTATVNFPARQSGQIAGTIVADPSGAGGNVEFPFSVNIISSPSLLITKLKDITSSQNGEVRVENTGNVQLNNIQLTSSVSSDVTFSDNSFPLAPGASKTIIVTPVNTTTLLFGINQITITAADAGQGVQSSVALSQIVSFCRAGEAGGNLEITDISIDSDGDDDEEWILLDTIEVEVQVENTNNDMDIDDVMVELGLFDSSGKNQANELEFENTDEEEIDLGDLNDGDEETVTFTFRVPADFDTGNYKLAVKAFSKKLKEENECADTSSDFSDEFFQDISVDKEDDEGKFIAFDSIQINPAQVTCGDTVTLTTDVFNVGDEDQDQVLITLKNTEMNLALEREIREDLNEGDKERVSFTFLVPQELKDQGYILELSADYDFRSSSNDYRESLDESTRVVLNVLGCSQGAPTPGTGTSGRIAAITAQLGSDAIAGQELIVNARITNLQNETASFIIDATDFESWALLNSISTRLLTLESGESRDITLSFNVDSDASGENSFFVEARSGEQVEPIAVEVTLGTGAAGTGFNFGDNTLIWVIGIINVVLIVLIIIIAVRISQR